MAVYKHLQALKVKHEELEKAIHDEMNHPLPNFQRLNRMKKQKLKVKEELYFLEKATHLTGTYA